MFNWWNFNILEILLQPTVNDLWLAPFSTATIYSTDIPAPQQPSPAPIRIFKQAWQTPDRRDHDHWGEGQMRHTRENSEWCWTLLPFALGHWMLWKWASFMGPTDTRTPIVGSASLSNPPGNWWKVEQDETAHDRAQPFRRKLTMQYSMKRIAH